MLKNFKTYQLAKELHQICKTLPVHREARDQRRFYAIAMGSLRKTQVLLEIIVTSELAIVLAIN